MEDFLLINKPAGMTSHDVVDAVRRVYHTRRVGHAGTLDPFATGLLIVGVEAATKKLGDLAHLPKTYEAVARLGATSTTGDPEGAIVENIKCQIPNIKLVQETLAKFVGEIRQTPPMYSAKKVGGQKLYHLARQGKVVPRQPQTITVHQLLITNLPDGQAGYQFPNLSFRTIVSSGTYIRTLAEDIGAALGCGAYLTELKRTAIGEYHLEDAASLKDLTLL